MTNGIVINGKAYEIHWASKTYIETTCYLCDLNRKCENAQFELCEVFDKKGRIPYFVKSKEGKV